jgi:multisubunit Na+/H+ antiporter MnhE subunit
MSTAGKPKAVRSWPARVVGLVVFGFCFCRELVLANISLAKAVLWQKNTELAPGFVTYSLKGLSRFEILVLTHCITLTPGTTSVEISADFAQLLVHAFDARDPEGVRASIKNGLENPILGWTR